MNTYLITNIIFIIVVILVLGVRPTPIKKSHLVIAAVLLVLTAVFDSLIVGYDIVGYNSDLILGVYIINAPVEDFFYAILALILIPRVWDLLEKKHV